MTTDILNLTKEEVELFERAVYVFRQKNMTDCSPRGVVVECLKTYLELYERRYGPQDALSQKVVHGGQYVKPPVTDLDEVARLLVKGGKCTNCGRCCQRTIGVRVTEEEVPEIEKLGYSTKDFLDEDGMIRSNGKGCYFLVMRQNGTSRCRIYEKRPQICRDYYCNGRH